VPELAQCISGFDNASASARFVVDVVNPSLLHSSQLGAPWHKASDAWQARVTKFMAREVT
jgi:hypothetical protein